MIPDDRFFTVMETRYLHVRGKNVEQLHQRHGSYRLHYLSRGKRLLKEQ